METIWIWNHYAGGMYIDRGGRHHNFAKYLIKMGYDVKIFASNVIHNSDKEFNTEGELYFKDIADNIPYVFVKTRRYSTNGINRVLNMIDFYRNLFKVAKIFIRKGEKPSLILASSVHPLTLVAGIKVGKKIGVPCICEVRDLWPESLVAYGIAGKNNPVIKYMYRLEKWIYERADALIFTMEGGKDYIAERGWDIKSGGKVDLKKVYYINNGVDLEAFEENKKKYNLEIPELCNNNTFKVLYTGSIRLVNQIELLVNAGKVIQNRGNDNIEILIFGNGGDRDRLISKCKIEGIKNVKFLGMVPKNYIPGVLSLSDVNIMVAKPNDLYRFGLSLNKMFEYLASGKPLISTLHSKYDIIGRYKCGITLQSSEPEKIADAIEFFYNMPENQYHSYCEKACEVAEQYDFKKLTIKLTNIFSSLHKNENIE